MDSLLDALQEGRLFELPDNDKVDALQFLAHIIEAFPEVPAGEDVVGHVLKREEATSTALGKGWACPHARLPFDEDLMCVVGWSPTGIDYGARDGERVSLVVMYLVPDNQRNHYLREVSTLAKAVHIYPAHDRLRGARNLDDVRNYLLDLIDVTQESATPDTRARMIRLQARPAAEAPAFADLSNLIVEPVLLINIPDTKPVVLTQNASLMESLDSAADLVAGIGKDGTYQSAGWRVLRRTAVSYPGGRTTYDCIAVKLKAAKPATRPADAP